MYSSSIPTQFLLVFPVNSTPLPFFPLTYSVKSLKIHPNQIQDIVSRCSAVGSAPALGAGCREFESRHLDQKPEMAFCHFGFLHSGGLENEMQLSGGQLLAAGLDGGNSIIFSR